MARPRANQGARRAAESGPPPRPHLAQVLDSYRWPIVAAMLLLFGTMAWTATREKAPAYDELAHLTAGYSYWLTGDFRLHPENGVLPQRWAALPVYFSGAHFPDRNEVAWWHSEVWVLGYRFFYLLHNDLNSMLWWARGLIVLLAMALGAVVYVWSRRLFGPGGAWISLVLYTFSPTMLAHAGLITSDLTSALAFVVSLGTLWMTLHRVDAKHVAASALAMGLLFVSKMSAILILPIAIILIAIRLIAGRPMIVALGQRTIVTSRLRQLAIVLATTLVHALAVIFIIWMFYGFHYSTYRESEPGREQMLDGRSFESLTENSMFGSVVRFANDHHLLPEPYLYGMAFSVERSKVRSAFLNGEVRDTGWKSFFPYAFIVKTPVATLGVVLLAVAAAAAKWLRHSSEMCGRFATIWSRAARGLYRTAPLTVFLAVYWAVAIGTHLNIGHRHILPTYPMMFILCGAAGFWCSNRYRYVAGIVFVLLAGVILESLAIRPHYLAYFNQFAGGPREGYRHLVDSSLDWGQDLPPLKQWLNTELPASMRDKPVYLSYFGTGSPEYYGLQVVQLNSVPDWRHSKELATLQPGTYCISATMLQSVYFGHPGPWTERSETAYQALLRDMTNLAETLKSNPQLLEQLASSPDGQKELSKINEVRRLYEKFRLDRLLSYLRGREPNAEVGYSILIYYLDRHDLDEALTGSASAWSKQADAK